MNTNIKFIDIQTPESAFKVDVDELTPLGFECVLDPVIAYYSSSSHKFYIIS